MEQGAPLATIEADEANARARLVSPDVLLGHLPAGRLSEDGTRRVTHGNIVGPSHLTDGAPAIGAAWRVRLIDPAGRLVAVAERLGDGSLHPVVVLV